MKTCNRCNIEEELTQFYKAARTKDGHQHTCKECCKPMHKAYNAKMFDARKSKRTSYRADNVARYRVWKAKQACACCGERETCCLDLHHPDPNEKEVTVSNVISYWSWERLKTEIDKCIVVCSNCHRKIHAGVISV